MKKVKLGKTGLMVSRVVMGGIPIQRPPFEEAVRIVEKAVELGINFFDTSINYEDSELRIGKGVKEHRDDVILATKGRWTDKKTAAECIDRSLERLGTDYIDLWQFHNPGSNDRYDGLFKPGGAYEAAEEALEEGKILHIGISLHPMDVALRAVESGKFETLQFPFNMVLREAKDRLIPSAAEHDVGFIGMKPFAGGRLTDPNLAIKFVLQHDNVVPDPGFQSVEEIRQVIEIAEGDLTLSEADLSRIEEIRAEVGTRFCRRCGYCTPCPQGVKIQNMMLLPIMYNEWPEDWILKFDYFDDVTGSTENCIDCGICEEKCPYHLPIREIMRENVEYYRRYVEARK
ncbi:aldo/keto reductase [Candidatus Bathyarchaeota archaeon]|nr:aldo/keto reductase [Candidatus Bathyarchaeota archaeon]